MKHITKYIQEKLKVGSKSKISKNIDELKKMIIDEIYSQENIDKDELEVMYLSELNDNDIFTVQLYLGKSEEKYLNQKLPKEFLDLPKERKVYTYSGTKHLFWKYKLQDLIDFYNGNFEELVNDLKYFFE